MTNMRERIARVVDPEIWSDDMPVPTRAEVEDFHRRRQKSIALAEAILAEMDHDLLYGTPDSTRRGLL